jgi:hypothetical protein
MSQTPSRLGESPFKVKGLVYVGAKEFYQQRVPGGVAAVAQEISDSQLRSYFQQTFFVVGKYDVLPLIPISEAAAKRAGISHQQLVTENSRWLAEQHIHGVYRALLKLATPQMVAIRLPRASLQYFTFGSAEGRLLGDNSLEAKQQGMPLALVSWMIWAVEGFSSVALTKAGAKNVQISMLNDPVRDGEVEGIETFSISWKISWTR